MIKKRKLWKAFAGTLAAMVSFVAVAQPISYLPNLENALVAEAYDVGYYVHVFMQNRMVLFVVQHKCMSVFM